MQKSIDTLQDVWQIFHFTVTTNALVAANRGLLNQLYFLEENLKAMLTNKNGAKDGARDSYNVLPTLLIMGKSPASDVHRHIVRAIDNLSSNCKYPIPGVHDFF